eukprot:697434-Pleurochrysis_carterae.AAC.1
MQVGFEVANVERAKYLLSQGEDDLKDEPALGDKDEHKLEPLAARILASCKMFVEGKRVVDCTYRHAMKNKEEGPLFGGHLQWTSSRISLFLFEGMASDINMNNAHLSCVEPGTDAF